MNFIGHIATGLRAGAHQDEASFLVGTALPDLAGMGSVRLLPAVGVLGEGIALHHATDRAFHADAWFIELERELRAYLAQDGLPDGASRAAGHVGVELLLDGALLADRAVVTGVGAVYERMASPDPTLVALAPATERDRWRQHLHGVARRLDPFGYRDPSVIARRLYNVTRRRPRLAFDAQFIDVVAVRVAALRPRVESSAAAVLDRVARRAITPREGNRRGRLAAALHLHR